MVEEAVGGLTKTAVDAGNTPPVELRVRFAGLLALAVVRIPVSGLGGIGDALAGSRIDCALGSAGATGQSEVLRGLEEAPAEGGTNGGSEYLTGLTLLPAILMLVLLVVLVG